MTELIYGKITPLLVFPGNPSKLMLSTVDPELTEMVRKIAGVPLIFLHGATMVLEKATNKSFKVAEEETKNAIAEDQVAVGQGRRE